jgi:hypothetical protein
MKFVRVEELLSKQLAALHQCNDVAKFSHHRQIGQHKTGYYVGVVNSHNWSRTCAARENIADRLIVEPTFPTVATVVVERGLLIEQRLLAQQKVA